MCVCNLWITVRYYSTYIIFWLIKSRSWVSQRVKLCIKSNGKGLCLIDNLTGLYNLELHCCWHAAVKGCLNADLLWSASCCHVKLSVSVGTCHGWLMLRGSVMLLRWAGPVRMAQLAASECLSPFWLLGLASQRKGYAADLVFRQWGR